MGEYKIGTTVFDGWEIVRQLGEGAFGKVFEVQKNAGGIVTRSALKVIRIPRSLSDYKDILSEGMDEKSATSYFQGIVTQLLKEIALMSDLKGHPNIVAYEDHQVEEDPNIVGWDILIRMELLTSLDDYQIAHPMDEAAVRKLGIDLCQALAFCQRKKALIHRDVKPGNIFVNEAGQFKLGDFGIARTVEQTISGMSRQGTESYMAPEVYLDKPYGVSTDLYSLGMVLYKLMNEGRLPFLPPAPQPINFAHRENARKSRMDGKPLPPPKNASPEFAAIILKACAYAPEDRYHTAADMLDALTGKTKAPESKRPEPIEPEPKPIEPEPEPLEPEPKMPESKPEPKPKPEPEPPKPEMPESKPEPSGRNESDRTEAEKKKKIILIGGGILALLLVIGCVLWGTGQKQNTADSTVQADTDDMIVSTGSDAEEFYTNTVSAMGFDSYVTVTMTYDYDNDSITDVEIDVSGETDGIGADIGDEMAARILEAQNADVDAVSGATITSEAVKDAADYCLFLFYAGLDSVTETLETDN